MRRRSLLKGLFPAAAAAGGVNIAYAQTYLTVEQAQKLLCPGESFTAKPIMLSGEQKKAIQNSSSVRVREDKIIAWRTSSGGWFIADNVIGKHEFIDFALALKADGSVKGVEILTYRETYGSEVRNPKWRAQFTGKGTGAPVKIDSDIKNISGATLSSVHITEGVRRLLHTWKLVLQHS